MVSSHLTENQGISVRVRFSPRSPETTGNPHSLYGSQSNLLVKWGKKIPLVANGYSTGTQSINTEEQSYHPVGGNTCRSTHLRDERTTGVSQVGVMRDGTQVRKTPRSITIWTRDVIRLSNPSRTVFGSSPTLTTKSHESELTARNRRQYSQVAELVDAKIIGGQRAIGEEPRKLRIQVRILS
jgi:hypothetical protein